MNARDFLAELLDKNCCITKLMLSLISVRSCSATRKYESYFASILLASSRYCVVGGARDFFFMAKNSKYFIQAVLKNTKIKQYSCCKIT